MSERGFRVGDLVRVKKHPSVQGMVTRCENDQELVRVRMRDGIEGAYWRYEIELAEEGGETFVDEALRDIAVLWPLYIDRPGTESLYRSVLDIAVTFRKSYGEVLSALGQRVEEETNE